MLYFPTMRAIIILAALTLAACSSPTLEDFADNCRAYGFKPGTPSFAHCVQSEDLAYRQRLMMGVQAVKPQVGW